VTARRRDTPKVHVYRPPVFDRAMLHGALVGATLTVFVIILFVIVKVAQQ
jgi:hypothetical protein